MIDKQTNILNKIEYLKDTLLDYAADRYDLNRWPIELEYDFSEKSNPPPFPADEQILALKPWFRDPPKV